MRINSVITILLAVLFMLSLPAGAVVVMDPLYQVEVFATYTNPTLADTGFGMVFDNAGNLYVPHVSGHVYKVTPNRNAEVFGSNAGYIRDMIWTGGTAYGDAFYVTDQNSNRIKKIDMNGTVTNFVTIDREPVVLELDRVGRYGGRLFTGMNVNDRIVNVLPNGTQALFSPFPYNNRGGVIGLAFDPGSRYGGLMYTGIFSTYAQAYRGVYSIDLSGNAVKFSKNLATGLQIEFDPGLLFGGGMFLMGQDILGGAPRLWKMDEKGIATLFADTNIWQLGGFCFGPDGAMYVSEFDYNSRMNTISRITLIPEPSSIFLILLGGLFISPKRGWK